MPVGSLLSRRAIWLPDEVQQPAQIQQPPIVVPSSRISPKPASCSPALRMSLVGSLGSNRSTRARPLYSLAISSERSEEHTSELQSPLNLVFRLLLQKIH